MDGQEVQFSPWHADFSAHNPASATALEFPIWLQILGLGLHFRVEKVFRIIGSKFGQVLHYDDGASFAGRTARPRIKILVRADMEIPEKILLPGSHPGVLHSHKLLVTGNPNQCVTCNTLGHNSRTCPRNLRNTNRDDRAPGGRPSYQNRRGGRNQWRNGGIQRPQEQRVQPPPGPARHEQHSTVPARQDPAP